MFVGGLGIMTAGLVILAAVGRRITLSQRIVVRDTMGATSLGGAVALGRYVLIFAIAVQAVGFVVLFIRLLFDLSVGEAAWQGLFHSVSAFNNAGFVIFEDSESLSAFRNDPLMLGIIGALIVGGALSFPVLAEVVRRRRPQSWSLDTRLVIIGSVGMWVLGGLALLLFEWGNDATMQQLSTVDKVSNGVFQALTARTAGFSSIDFSETRAGTDFLFTFLMFVGGASGSVAGGIKVNTMMVLVFASLASVGGRTRTEMFKRELPAAQVARALAVFLLAALALLVLIASLALTESASLESGAFDFIDVLFEATSAFGTTGLSRGITSDLTDPGKLVITLAMYLGRLGPLTIALGLALRERRAVYRFAQERVRIG
jgi:trk system potassium uptake protein TrkH